MPAKQCSSPGSGPAGPENFGYFPSLESSPPAGGISPKTKQRFRRCGGEFLSERSERNQRIAGGRGFWERPAAHALVFHEPLSPGPPFLRGSPLCRWQSRSARRPLERCLNFITAVLLSEPAHLLLQDDMRLSSRTYTVGGGRRAHTVRPYKAALRPARNIHSPIGALLSARIPRGEFHKGGPEPPFWSFQGEGVTRGRGKFEIPLPLVGVLPTLPPRAK